MRQPTLKKQIAICDEQAVINGGTILKHTKATYKLSGGYIASSVGDVGRFDSCKCVSIWYYKFKDW